MSAFEITVTPTRAKNKKLVESREPTVVVMAPFSAKAIVQFEDVPVGKTAKRTLRVLNTSDDDIEVKVTKYIKDEHNITIDWTEKLVTAQGEVEMAMSWSPQIDTTCKEILQLTDNRNFRKDVMIILKSKCNQPKKTARKFPTVSSSNCKPTHVKTLRLKSPTSSNKTHRTSLQTHHIKSQSHTRKEKQNSPKNCSHQATKLKLSNQQKIVEKPTIKITRTSPLAERNIYDTEKNTKNKIVISPLSDDALKENISPSTPVNVLSLIDKLNFTPATATKSNFNNKLENLFSWPTPETTVYTQDNSSAKKSTLKVLPRCLMSGDLQDIEEADPSLSPKEKGYDDVQKEQIVPNKTFEVKRSETFDISTAEMLEISLNDNSRLSMGPGLNKTTTITAATPHRALEMIQEEDCSMNNLTNNTTTGLQKTYNMTVSTNVEKEVLKRDIKLIGTPLRKYSESMKDLSIKSPQSKLGIQGSMPNLNEMENIRSIEQNRYFYQSNSAHLRQLSGANDTGSMSVIEEQATPSMSQLKNSLEDSLNDSNVSLTSTVSHAELMFNQSEILAQSSRFNLNEVGLKSRKYSPTITKKKGSKETTNSTLASTPIISNKNLRVCENKEACAKKRRSQELSFSDATSTDSIVSSCSLTKTAGKKLGLNQLSPPKRSRLDAADISFPRPSLPANASATRNKNWSFTQPKKFKLAQTLSLMKKPITPRRIINEKPVKLYDSDLFLQSYINPDPFAATITCDPFLASTMYLDERAVDRHQIDFKKWLNALVTIPADLDAECNAKIDVGKLFNEVRNKDLILAPTKEEQSMHYLTTFRLESLRRAAVQLFLSEEMRVPCSKVAVYVNKNAIKIRSDRNLHLDVVMQRYILELLLCFNPLWLRLGLEVVYGEKIHLNSNSDIVGLSLFILNRLFRDKFLEQKYSKAYTLSDEYADHIKKFTLQKMLFLLLFLDKAKSQRIIKHNPCLFNKKSPHKETKDILLRFSCELLANIGDITRELKRLGYVLQHKQSFLDEFDYAFNNLAVDLRDGIRLTRVMEIILLRDDLSKLLRVPAISRLQRVFNVNLGLRALAEADFELKGEITAADIVDGHREKTLSLLWQIIYKFRSPKFHAAARVLQHWWRNSWLRVVVERRIRHKENLRREAAAMKIQAAYRGHITRKFVKVYRTERTLAVIVLQKHVRRFLAQKRRQNMMQTIIFMQRWYRAQLLGRHCRQQFVVLRSCVVFIQRTYKRRLFAAKLLQAAKEARLQLAQKRDAAAMCIQAQWRAYKKGKEQRNEFLRILQNVIMLQRRYRANKAKQQQQGLYKKLRLAVVNIQKHYRAWKLMKEQRKEYLHLRNLVIKMQQRRRATILMREAVTKYIQERNSILQVQRIYRAKLAMHQQRNKFIKMLEATLIIQSRFRAYVARKKQMQLYQKIRNHVICIQRKWRATLLSRKVRVEYIALRCQVTVLQQKYRGRKLMRMVYLDYQQLRSSTILVQRRYRALQAMRTQRMDYLQKVQSVLTIQRYFRGYKQMRYDRARYQGVKTAVLCLQEHIRGYLQMKCERAHFLKLKNAAISVQTRFKAKQLMLKQHALYGRQKAAAISIQRYYRGVLLMRQQRRHYMQQRQVIVQLQCRYRAVLLGKRIRREYLEQRSTIIKLQQRYRANLLMRKARKEYLGSRLKIIKLQQRVRANLAMRRDYAIYSKQRHAAICLQQWYRSLVAMRETRKKHEIMRRNVVYIQQKWRATVVARTYRVRFLDIISKVVFIQRVLRATIAMRQERNEYDRLRGAAIALQRRYRARLQMLQMRSQYLLIRSLIVCIQRKFRAHLLMVQQRQDFLQLRNATILLQQKFRGRNEMRKQYSHFQLLRRSIVDFQAQARGYLARNRFQQLMTPEMMDLQRQKKAARLIQRFWRGYRIRKRFHSTRILIIRKTIKELRQTSNTINSVRTKIHDAVHLLRGRFSASEALHVLLRLDRLSRTVPHLLMGHSDFISTFCYGIMAQAIRSEVDKQLIEYCSRIILNLARYNSTTANTFQEGGLVTIAQMLLRWCDKDCEIFNTLCTLIWVFAHCPEKRQIIRDFMTTPDSIYMVRETKKLVVRKEKMKQNVRNVAILSRNNQQTFSSRALPSLEPDYGIIRNQPYTFISSVYAFDTILCKLGINIF